MFDRFHNLYTNYGMKCDPIQMIDIEQYFAPIIFLYKGSWLMNLWVKFKVWALNESY